MYFPRSNDLSKVLPRFSFYGLFVLLSSKRNETKRNETREPLRSVTVILLSKIVRPFFSHSFILLGFCLLETFTASHKTSLPTRNFISVSFMRFYRTNSKTNLSLINFARA